MSRLAHGGEAGAFPGRRIALGDEGAHVRRVAVMVGVEGAVLVLDERLRERRKRAPRAVPGELVRALALRGAEVRRAAHRGIGAIGADHQVVAVEARHACVSYSGAMPTRRELLAQQPQKMQPPDRGEADAVDHHRARRDARP